jgi:hypothetical protein
MTHPASQPCNICCLPHAVPAGDEGDAALLQLQNTAARVSSRTPAFPQAANASEFPAAAHDALALDALLSPEERDVRRRVRAFAESEVAPIIAGVQPTNQPVVCSPPRLSYQHPPAVTQHSCVCVPRGCM